MKGLIHETISQGSFFKMNGETVRITAIRMFVNEHGISTQIDFTDLKGGVIDDVDSQDFFEELGKGTFKEIWPPF